MAEDSGLRCLKAKLAEEVEAFMARSPEQRRREREATPLRIRGRVMNDR